jgi:hypothetical protein
MAHLSVLGGLCGDFIQMKLASSSFPFVELTLKNLIFAGF